MQPALTRKVVELHGGRISVESELGTGSTFTFTVPLRGDLADSGATERGEAGGVRRALKHRLPTVVGGREYAEAGGLLSYAVSYPGLFRRAALYVDKILEGARPAELPVEQPTKLELVINLRTAKALGLTVPRSVLLRADEVIQ